MTTTIAENNFNVEPVKANKFSTKAKIVLAHVATAKELVVMCIFKTGLAVLPPRAKDKLMMLPIKGMGLDGEEERELREKYFNQSAEDSRNFIASSNIVKFFIQCRISDVYRTARLGKLTPNTEVYDFDLGKEARLLDYQRRNVWDNSGRPLVIDFGSCT